MVEVANEKVLRRLVARYLLTLVPNGEKRLGITLDEARERLNDHSDNPLLGYVISTTNGTIGCLEDLLTGRVANPFQVACAVNGMYARLRVKDSDVSLHSLIDDAYDIGHEDKRHMFRALYDRVVDFVAAHPSILDLITYKFNPNKKRFELYLGNDNESRVRKALQSLEQHSRQLQSILEDIVTLYEDFDDPDTLPVFNKSEDMSLLEAVKPLYDADTDPVRGGNILTQLMEIAMVHPQTSGYIFRAETPSCDIRNYVERDDIDHFRNDLYLAVRDACPALAGKLTDPLHIKYATPGYVNVKSILCGAFNMRMSSSREKRELFELIGRIKSHEQTRGYVHRFMKRNGYVDDFVRISDIDDFIADVTLYHIPAATSRFAPR